MSEQFIIRPIGKVHVGQGRFYLEIESEYRGGLKQLEGFSHLNVFWWAHLGDNEEMRATLVCDKPYTKGPDKIGVFATRSQFRPNPLAVTPVGLFSVSEETGIIELPYIDAEDETPIIDIKPYHGCSDRVRDIKVPEWCSHWPQWYEDNRDFDWEAEFNF